MNEETAQQMLTELKRLRHITQITSIAALVVLVAVCVYGYIRLRPISADRKPQADTWGAVHSAMTRFDYDNAAAIAHHIVEKHPNDYYGYTYLGTIALALNHPEEAETDYAHACELLPTEENQKMLDAIRKRLAKEAKAGPP
jgi:cytochrome c-type biogenesis protein CcmH/NrfG